MAHSSLIPIFESAGIDADQELIVRREITSNGKTRFFICGQLITASLLKQIRPFIVDIYGQGEQHTLLDRGNYLSLLDNFGNLTDKAEKVRSTYETWFAADEKYRELAQSESERIRQRDVWQFEAEEIAKVKPTAGEDTSLERERSVLANAERISQLADYSYGVIYEHEGSVVSMLGAVKRKLDDLNEIDPAVGNLGAQVDASRYALEDVAYALRDYLSGIEVSPDRQTIVEDRLVELERLKRKYGGTLEKVIAHWEQTQERLDQFGGSEASCEKVRGDAERARERYSLLANELSKARKDAANGLEKRIGYQTQAVGDGKR